MKEERILRAIGQLDEELVAQAQIKEATHGRNAAGRKLLRCAIAACLAIALLTTAVLAAKSWFFNGHRAQVIESKEAFTASDAKGNSSREMVYELSFCLPLRETAPQLLERYYFPSVPTEYPLSFGYAYAGLECETLCDITFFWDVPSGAKSGIRFTQESRYGLEQDGKLTENELKIVVFSSPEETPLTQEITLGGVSGLLITEPEGVSVPRQYFYWSDGDYVFHMWFPLAMTEEEMAQMIGSVKQVEDIRPQLISMTDEALKQTFG